MTGMWSNITDEDIENADDEVMNPDEGMGGDMFGNSEQQETKDSRPFELTGDEWNETDHPRDETGKFASHNGGGKSGRIFTVKQKT